MLVNLELFYEFVATVCIFNLDMKINFSLLTHEKITFETFTSKHSLKYLTILIAVRSK